MNKKKLHTSKTLYKRFLGFLIKKGNLISAKKILDKTFFDVSKKTGYPTEIALLKLFLILNSFVEVKKVRIRRKSFLVPFSITLKRRSYLIVRWLMQAVDEDSSRDTLSAKLSTEIIKVLTGVNTRSKKFKSLNASQAMANRSNIHYRW
jgi:ribosomal protein S7